MTIEPGALAWADQRIAEAGEFLDILTEAQRVQMETTGDSTADAIAVNAFSAHLEFRLTGESLLPDLLALAVRRLACR